jgi:chaperonin GroES
VNIKPLSDHILLEPIKEEEKTKSGIFLPETASKERSEEGKVIAVGPGKRNEKGEITPVAVKPGDKVLFTKYGPNEIKVGDKEYLIAREDDILAVVDSDNSNGKQPVQQVKTEI